MAEERVQRRLVAIVAADVVGYSRLMRADEDGTLARLKALREELLHPKVEEYGGRIVKTTGDGTLIEFSSAVDAVQHAVDVQRAMAQRNAASPDDRRFEIRMSFRESGGTILMVSHDLSAVSTFCQRAVWLDHGKTRMVGEAKDTVDAYLRAVAENTAAD